jgi:hypothetical protein
MAIPNYADSRGPIFDKGGGGQHKPNYVQNLCRNVFCMYLQYSICNPIVSTGLTVRNTSKIISAMDSKVFSHVPTVRLP